MSMRRDRLRVFKRPWGLGALVVLVVAVFAAASMAQTIQLKGVKKISDDGVLLEWSVGATGRYDIEISQTPDFGSTQTHSRCGQTYDDSGVLQDGFQYFYRVVDTTVSMLTVDAGSDQSVDGIGGGVNLGGAPTASNGAPPYAYLWTPATDLDDPTSPNPYATPTAETTYTCTVTDAEGCTAEDSVTITIGVATLTVDAGPDVAGCSGIAATIGKDATLIATGGTPPYTCVWSPDDGTLSDINICNPVANPATSTLYTVTVEDSLGVTGDDSVQVTVDPKLIVNAGVDNYTCDNWNSSVQIGGFPAASGGTAPFDYQWTPNQDLSSDTVPNPLCSARTDTTYTLSVVDDLGCSETDDVFVTYAPYWDQLTCDTVHGWGSGFGQCGPDWTQLDSGGNNFSMHDEWCKVILIDFSAWW
jgi:hypothetical protein